VSQIGTEPLEMRETILGYSSSPTMSAMLAVLKLYYVRQDTYIEAMLALRVRALFHAEIREEELITRIAELQLDVHRLNNIINPVPHPVPFNHEEAPSEEDEDDSIISNGESEEDM